MWIYWGLVAVFGILMILSAGTEMDPEVKWYQKPFCRGAEYLLIMRSRWKKKQNKKENKKEREKLETYQQMMAQVKERLEGLKAKQS